MCRLTSCSAAHSPGPESGALTLCFSLLACINGVFVHRHRLPASICVWAHPHPHTTITFLINQLIKPVTKIGHITEAPRASWWLTSLLWVFKFWEVEENPSAQPEKKQSWPSKPGLNDRSFLCFAASIDTVRVCCRLVHKANNPPGRLQQPRIHIYSAGVHDAHRRWPPCAEGLRGWSNGEKPSSKCRVEALCSEGLLAGCTGSWNSHMNNSLA